MRLSYKAINLLTMCLLSSSVAGCVVKVKATVSVPQVPAASTGKKADEMLHLKLAGLTLSTQMYNYHRGEQKGKPPIGLWLNLYAPDDTFTFDPGLVTLAAGNASPARSITILGPAEPWKSPRSVSIGCGPRRYERGWAFHKMDITDGDINDGNPAKGIWKQSPGPVPLKAKASMCFVLFFDIDPDPDQTFVLSVQGARRAGEPFSIPDITFSKGVISKSVIP